MSTLRKDLLACRICADRFAVTETAHSPRPVLWFAPSARILIAGQAPGLRVHQAGRPFADASGDRLRGWMGLSEAQFYDQSQIAIVPMGFCFPGYRNGADLPPPAICARTWRARVLAQLPDIRLTLVIGAAAQRWHLGTRNVTQTVAAWAEHAPQIWPLPHPSWRNTGWIKKHPWFEADLLPALRTQIKELL